MRGADEGTPASFGALLAGDGDDPRSLGRFEAKVSEGRCLIEGAPPSLDRDHLTAPPSQEPIVGQVAPPVKKGSPIIEIVSDGNRWRWAGPFRISSYGPNSQYTEVRFYHESATNFEHDPLIVFHFEFVGVSVTYANERWLSMSGVLLSAKGWKGDPLRGSRICRDKDCGLKHRIGERYSPKHDLFVPKFIRGRDAKIDILHPSADFESAQ